MPSEVNGFGTAYRGYAAAVQWYPPGEGLRLPDHDAVECIVAGFYPIIPLRAVHTYEWFGNSHRVVPIRISPRLLARAYLRPLATLLFCLAVFGLVSLIGSAPGRAVGPFFRGEAPAHFYWFLAALAIIGGAWLWLWRLDSRDRDIRLLLGRHEFGSSDPALWPEAILSRLRPNGEWLGAEDECEAAREALGRRHFGRAMLAARLAVARGNADGEAITRDILAAAELDHRLGALRHEPWRRGELLPEPPRPRAIAGEPGDGERPRCARDGKEMAPQDAIAFYDGRIYCTACLDQAGGPGFGQSVRREPSVSRRVPDGLVWTGFFVILALACGAYAATPLFDPFDLNPAKETPWLGMLVGAAFAYGAVVGRRRRARIEAGALRVDGQSEGLLDSITAVRRTHWMVHSPLYVAEGESGVRVQWPRTSAGAEEVERIVLAAIALREPDRSEG